MQKLLVELKNTPRDVQLFQVPCSVSSSLNREETLSVKSKVLANNNPEGTHSQHTGRSLKPLAYVLSMEGTQLMPCSQAKAKRMLKKGGAHVVKIFPFTIRLNFKCKNKVQKTTLGIDSGYENIGFSIVSDTKELLSGIVKLDGKTSKRLLERKMYRRGRRNKLWYRKPRFLNRNKKEGWLPPSIQRRYDTHLELIKKLKNILPVSEVIIEKANFDIQKILDPEIQGIKYQHGDLYGYNNMKNYLMAREHGKCQLCKKDFKGEHSHIHHCEQRKEGGSNRAENLAILHMDCHKKLHKMGLKLSEPKSYKPNTFMSIIHKKFKMDIPNIKITYGYITFINRNKLSLEKSHSTDAFIIAGGTTQKRSLTWNLEQRHRHNRAIQLNRKGFKPSIRTSIYKIQPKDLVKINNKWVETNGSHCKGKRIIINKKSVNINMVEKVFNFGNLIWRMAIPPLPKERGLLAKIR